MGEEKETIELTESELAFVLDLTTLARGMYRVAHGLRAFCSTHDEVERKVSAALDRIAQRTGGRSA